ncbi:DNA phosphorothioation-associated protein 4 [Geothermobacter hydrogeniphilus]|uniref:DNA phosphorothioation-associated protein 4 n=1 Tax=Geothermobacter hydrogeniphilus TaxID=1969733 RepID=A0A2K2H5Z7_9BACT|nr:DNA phosphorothioation-associated protein 4 [Geothermobacter hydrogeniphilus]PNU18660.1 DNA phosphorothioation-associated protein 4 [Geothermobacter hydrogeniphilus]
MADRVRRPVEFDKMLNELRDEGIFKTYKDALVFAACLGKNRGKRVAFEKSGEPINLQIFSAEFDQMVLNCIAISENSEPEIMGKDREDEKVRIFEEYACGGLEILKNEFWDSRLGWESGLVNLILREEKEDKILTDITMLGD